jgi:hypothetical protein
VDLGVVGDEPGTLGESEASASQQTVSRIPAAVPVWRSRSRKLTSGRKFAFTAKTFHSSALSRAEPLVWKASLRTARNSSSVSAV